MRPCRVVEIETPKRYRLNGLWFGPVKPRTVIVWVHGLHSSAFSRAALIDALTDDETAVLAFNNRGHDSVTQIVRRIKSKEKKMPAGAAHELFTDCVDDIDGAIAFAEQSGALKLAGRAKVAKATSIARAMCRGGKEHELMPARYWRKPVDARRFLSLYTPDSIEQSIFSYFEEESRSKMLRSIKAPILTLLAERDEYADRPASRIARWFEREVQAVHRVDIIPGATHGFSEAVAETARAIQDWLRER